MKYSSINKSSCVCITLCRAANALTEYYDERLESLGITVKQYSLLSNLARLGEASTSELAEYVNLERSTLTRNISVLESKGWLKDQADEGRRAHRYSLTRDGEKAVESAEAVWRGVQAEVYNLLGEDQISEFMSNLGKIQELKLENCSNILLQYSH